MLTCVHDRIFFEESCLKAHLTVKCSLLGDWRHGAQSSRLCTRRQDGWNRDAEGDGGRRT